MHIDPHQNYFELFGLPVSFDINSDLLSLAWRDLQRATHPDRFAHGTAQERRIAVQQAALVNEAYDTLRVPLKRAKYLLALSGYSVDEQQSAMDPLFLMEQMELREQLGEVRQAADPFTALDRVRSEVEARERVLMVELSNLLAPGAEGDPEAAGSTVRKLQFLDKLLVSAAELEEDLVHSH